jgi:hypothetical protein
MRLQPVQSPTECFIKACVATEALKRALKRTEWRWVPQVDVLFVCWPGCKGGEHH